MHHLSTKPLLIILIPLLSCLGAALLLSSHICHTAGNTYYVASNASDLNSGTQSSPFRTIQKAASVAQAGDTVYVRAGTYRETVTPAHSGTASAPITFAPYNGESVTVSGADIVSDWSSYSGSIYKSQGMNWDRGTGSNQVFVDGTMMVLARWPNTSLDVSNPTWAFAGGGSPSPSQISGQNIFPWIINDSSLTQPDGFWNGAEITHLGDPDIEYYAQSGTVTSYSRGTVEFQNFAGDWSRFGIAGGTKYYLSNKLEALDTAGEWYFDGSTLYLWTPSGDDPSNHTIEAKRRQFAFELKGRSYIVIQGFTIFASSISTDSSSSHNVIDGIHAKYVWHQSRVSNGDAADPKWSAWETGILLNGSENVLKNCEIAYSSGDGVYLLGAHQTVTNCVIHDVAYVPAEAAAVATMGEYGVGCNSFNHEIT